MVRATMFNAFNLVLAATSVFLRNLPSSSDHSNALNEASITCNPMPESDLLLSTLGFLMNTRSDANPNRRIEGRRAEMLSMKNSHVHSQYNTVTQYPEARDIRPLGFRSRRLIPRNTASSKIKRRERKRLESSRENQITSRPRMSNQLEGLDKYVMQRSTYLPDDCQYRTCQTTSEAITTQGKVCHSNFVHTPAISHEHRTIHQNCVRPRRTDLRISEKDRGAWSPVCCKRQREVTFQSIMEEPEYKIPKIAQYWVVRKADADGNNDMGQRRNETIMLDWCQYELERSLWPRRYMKRKHKMTLESLREEPKQKVRRIGE